jgi:hypothetical protein
MRKDVKSNFKGSCLVEYDNAETANKVSSLGAENVKYGEKALRELCMMEAWYTSKKAYNEKVRSEGKKGSKGEKDEKAKKDNKEDKKEEADDEGVSTTYFVLF